MRTIALVQARMHSTRLPGKIGLPLAGKPMLVHVLERACRAQLVERVVLAIPSKDVEAIKAIVADFEYKEQVGVYLSDDPENDLVARFCGAAALFRADVIVRLCADNPCLDPTYIDEAIRTYSVEPAVCVSNTTDCCDGLWLDGIGAEVLSHWRMRWLEGCTRSDPEYREHPHQFFVDLGARFHPVRGWTWPEAQHRLDINTQEDYDHMRALFDVLGPACTTHEIVAHLKGVSHAAEERV